MEEKTVYINYFGEIVPNKVNALMSIIGGAVQQHNPDTIYFGISSNGGDVNSGIAFYNFLKALPVKVIMHNTGTIDSIANVVFLAGKERYANEHTTFLFHGVTMGIGQNSSFMLNQLKELESRLREDQNKMAGIICKESKIDTSEINTMFKEGESKNGTFALEKGIISEIKQYQIPKGVLLITPNLG